MENIKKLFKKWAELPSESVQPSALPSIDKTEEIIQQIHNEFDNSSNELIAEANKILAANSTFNQEKVDMLRQCGFNEVKEVLKQKEESYIRKIANDNLKFIQYYQMYYPNNRFITEQQISTICRKYNLVFGRVTQYTGFVPLKNIKEIAAFKVREEDETYELRSSGRYGIGYTSITKNEYLRIKKEESERFRVEIYDIHAQVTPFFICAPLKDMQLEYGQYVDQRGFIIEIPDPIVLCKVNNGYLIISKWGLEASDPIVQNEKMN